MKKQLLLLTFLLLGILLKSQGIAYFSTTSMQPYMELENPISINNDEIWNRGSIFTLYFDFQFTIFDQIYSSINVEAGGGLFFAGLGSKILMIYHTPFEGYMLTDKGETTSVSNLDYEVVGEEGQYIIKIQWQNAGFVQWYSSSDPTDFVDFQIWIFQEDGHLELHFGPNQADPGTYGYPEATSDPNPGPSIKYDFEGCGNVLSYTGSANNPSYDYYNFCDPNYAFIDGTPSEGITYTLIRNENYVGIPDTETAPISLFPNPASQEVQISGLDHTSDIQSVIVMDYQGKTVHEYTNFKNSPSKIAFSVQDLPSGIYWVKILGRNQTTVKKLIKSGR